MNRIKSIFRVTLLFVFTWNLLISQANYHLESGDYPLIGSHREVPCVSCHKETKPFKKVSRNCESCHMKSFVQASVINHLERFYQPSQCESCHSAEAWSPNIYVHDPDIIECVSCHTHDLVIANTKINGHSTLANDCTVCHLPESPGWNIISFNHSNAKYSLKKDELSQDCISCHPNGFLGVKAVCDSCSTNKIEQVE